MLVLTFDSGVGMTATVSEGRLPDSVVREAYKCMKASFASIVLKQLLRLERHPRSSYHS